MTTYAGDRHLVATQGQDFACQVWVSDHRSEPVPYTIPARMTVKDSVGQTVFETADDMSVVGTDALILTSPANGLLQVTVPRVVLAMIPPGTYTYDIWATVIDEDTTALFPDGQLVPVTAGRFTVRSRTTVMEDTQP